MKSKLSFVYPLIQLTTSTFSFSLQAGEHKTNRDDFTEETSNIFISTTEEDIRNKAIYAIAKYKPVNNTVLFIVQPISGTTECNNKYLLIKDSNGKIHKIDALEKGLNKCIVLDLDADLVRKPFRVRIPMHSGADLDIDVDTKSLNLSKLK